VYKIAILNTTHFENKGSMGRLEGLIRCLEKTIPGCEITILHRYFKQDAQNLSKQLMDKYNSLEIIEHPWYKEANSPIMTAVNSLIRYLFLKFRKAFLKSQLQQDEPDDYVIATGECHSVREFLEETFTQLDLDWRDYVEIDPRYLRPTEVDHLQGDSTKARRKLGWKPKVDFRQLVKMMLQHDLDLARQEKLLKDAGHTAILRGL